MAGFGCPPRLAAARTVDLQTVEQLLDAVLDIAAGTVDFLVDKARRLAQIGDDEARVVARLAVGEPHDFGFDHDTALMVPRARSIATGVGVDVRRLVVLRALGPRLDHRGRGVPQQDGVLGHRHDVVEPRLGVEKVEDFRGGKAPVEPDEDARPRKRAAQQRKQPRQHPQRPVGSHRLARPQHSGAQILLDLAKRTNASNGR